MKNGTKFQDPELARINAPRAGSVWSTGIVREVETGSLRTNLDVAPEMSVTCHVDLSGLNCDPNQDFQTRYPDEQNGDSGQFLQIRQKNPK